jgi:hypothetical protein
LERWGAVIFFAGSKSLGQKSLGQNRWVENRWVRSLGQIVGSESLGQNRWVRSLGQNRWVENRWVENRRFEFAGSTNLAVMHQRTNQASIKTKKQFTHFYKLELSWVLLVMELLDTLGTKDSY